MCTLHNAHDLWHYHSCLNAQGKTAKLSLGHGLYKCNPRSGPRVFMDQLQLTVMPLDAGKLASDKAILAELKILYGQPSLLKVQFFQCRQKEDESVEFYVLRFQELFNRWRENEPQGAAQSEVTARDQFVIGLRAGKVQCKLNRQVRQKPDLICTGLP